jgi:radical SAM protein, tatD family-associated
MTIVYVFENTLYLNITNRCTNSCDFCVRTVSDGYYSENSLWLEYEPSLDEILTALEKYKFDDYKEIVFCGYGEPTCRLNIMLQVCRFIRKKSGIKIRLNTNGHASLIEHHDTAPLFEGLLDTVSVSLNTADAESYQNICHSKFGKSAFYGMLDFAREVKKYVPEVLFSVVRTTIPESDVEKCKKIADEYGIRLRVRELV